jgi:Tfp pilus assembly protein FimT
MMIVVVILFIMGGTTFFALQTVLSDTRINGAYDNALMQLRVARERAIEERKQYIVCFGAGSAPLGAATPLGAPNAQSVQLYRWDAGTALAAAVQISTVDLPFDVQFQTIAGVPTNPASVPDKFGTGGTAIDFDQAVAGGVKNQVMFMPDGSAQDVNGNLNNGVLYIARNANLYSSKAITVFGSTGRIRGFRLVQVAGAPTWIQQ